MHINMTQSDNKPLKKYDELTTAIADARADLRGLRALLEVAVKGVADGSCPAGTGMETLRFGFGLERRFSRLLGEAEAALRSEFPDASEQTELHKALSAQAPRDT